MVREQMLDMAQSVLGKTFGPGGVQGIDSPEELMEALIQQVHTFQEAEDARQAARRSPSSIGPSAQGPGEAQDAKAALRSIYRQLASALHPDREPDPVERERKSALMARPTQRMSG